MTVGIIIQARMGSTRLPGKVLMNIKGMPILWHIVNRLKKVSTDKIIIATTIKSEDNAIQEFCDNNGLLCFRGSEHDVLDRYYECAKKYELEHIIRITGDCPLIDESIVNNILAEHIKGNYDYSSNVIIRSYPRGLDTEILTFKLLSYLNDTCNNKEDREHVTLFVRNNINDYDYYNHTDTSNLSFMNWSVDTRLDYELVSKIYSYFDNNNFTTDDVLNIIMRTPILIGYNIIIPTNKGVGV